MDGLSVGGFRASLVRSVAYQKYRSLSANWQHVNQVTCNVGLYMPLFILGKTVCVLYIV